MCSLLLARGKHLNSQFALWEDHQGRLESQGACWEGWNTLLGGGCFDLIPIPNSQPRLGARIQLVFGEIRTHFDLGIYLPGSHCRLDGLMAEMKS